MSRRITPVGLGAAKALARAAQYATDAAAQVTAAAAKVTEAAGFATAASGHADDASASAALARDISNIDTTDDAVDAALNLPGSKSAATLSASYAGKAETRPAQIAAAARGVLIDDFRDPAAWTPTSSTKRQGGSDQRPTLLVRNTIGATGRVVRDVNLDLRGKFLSVEVESKDANFVGLHLRLAAGSREFGPMFTRFNLLTGPTTGTSAYRALTGRRQLLTVPMAALVPENGAASLADIRAIRFEVLAATGTSTEVELANLRVHDQVLDSGVIFQFDDGLQSVYDTAFPIMQAAGIVGAVGVSPTQVGTPGYASLTQLKEMQAAGWEMIGHDTTDYATKTQAQLLTSFRDVQDYMRTHFGGTEHFVYVGGSYNEDVMAEALRHFRTARSVASDNGSRHETPFIGDLARLRTLYLNATITQATARGWLDDIVARGAVSYLSFHDIVAANPVAEAWTTADFQSLVNYFVTTGLVAYTPSEVWPEIPESPSLTRATITPARSIPGGGGGLSVACIGNTLEEGGQGSGGTSNAARTLGGLSYVTQMAVRSGGRLRLVRNAGLSNDTGALMLSRFDADVAPYAPKVVIIGVGEHDLISLTPSQTMTNVQALVGKVRGIGAIPVLRTTVPRSTVVTLAKIVEFNLRITRYAHAEGLQLLDFYSLLVSDTDGTLYANPAFVDAGGTFPRQAGAVAMADYALATLLPSLPDSRGVFLAQSNNDPHNLFINGLMMTDAGDGVPDSWAWSNTVGTTAALVPGVKGQMFQFNRRSGSTRATLMQTLTVASGKFAPGDKLALGYRMQADGAAVTYNGLYGLFNGAAGSVKTFDAGAGPLADGVGYYEFTVPAGVTSIDFYFANDPGVGKVRVGQATCRNLTALGMA